MSLPQHSGADFLDLHGLTLTIGEPFRPGGREVHSMRGEAEILDSLQWVWVMSPHTGGQVRMRHTRPDYRGPWPALDRAVAARCSAELFDAIVWDPSGPSELWRAGA